MSRNFCEACNMYAHGAKTRIAIPHTCDDNGERVFELVRIQKLNKSGFAGCDRNGTIVDRRQYPQAMPIAKNSMFGITNPRCIECHAESAPDKLICSYCPDCWLAKKTIYNPWLKF
jgi:hypothetical protein